MPQLRHHLDAYADPEPDGRVFVGLYGATPLSRNFALIWKRAKIKAGPGVPAELHFHDLRHTGNHFAAASGPVPGSLWAARATPVCEPR